MKQEPESPEPPGPESPTDSADSKPGSASASGMPPQTATAPAPSTAPAPPPPAPPRIKSFTLCDFRAFPGRNPNQNPPEKDPCPVTFQLDGKNLLIYGENGSGKSSIFHALNEFFSIERDPVGRKQRLAELRNRFSGCPEAEGYVEVEFDDGKPAARWDYARHPADPGKDKDDRVLNGAWRKAFLDYRALLDTNYRHGSGEVNLFDVCVRVLLRDYKAPHGGQQTTRLFDLWQRLENWLTYPQLHGARLQQIYALSASFNQALQEALGELPPKVDSLLADLGWNDLKLTGLTTPGIAYNNSGSRAGRGFNGKEVTPELTFRTLSIPAPQTFLNEARLSALALAIYLAGRKVCAETTLPDTPRLMVLDDVLIGLDQSNRMPILDLLTDHFQDWQIILLTHDRVWFEMARAYYRQHKADLYWRYAKIHSNDDPTQAPVVTEVGSSAAVETLKNAQGFLDAGHINAAGNYARIAAELALREFCEVKKIKIAYNQEPNKTPASDLLSAAKVHSNTANGKYDEPLDAIDMYSTILLNPLSHGGIPTVTKYEVQGAIVAVSSLLFAVKVIPNGPKPENQ